MSELDKFVPQPTGDGSLTFFSSEFGESFHSHFGAKQESFLKFTVPTKLAETAHKSTLRILDVCYGLGYNTAAALETIWAVNPNCLIEVIALEINPYVPKAAIAHNLFDNWKYPYTPILSQLALEQEVNTDYLHAQILTGDARSVIKCVYEGGFLADAVFLDPFSPPQCPQLWTVEFIQAVAKCLHPQGLLATYSCAAAVRTALLAAGLQIGSTPPVGRKTPGTIAAHTTYSYPHGLPPLSRAEQEHLQTRAAIPYRDPCLTDAAMVILERRQKEQQASPLETTSHWRKRWFEEK